MPRRLWVSLLQFRFKKENWEMLHDEICTKDSQWQGITMVTSAASYLDYSDKRCWWQNPASWSSQTFRGAEYTLKGGQRCFPEITKQEHRQKHYPSHAEVWSWDMRALGFPSTALRLQHYIFSISSATGRKQEETMGAFVKLDSRGIQRLYFSFLWGKHHSSVVFSLHIDVLLLRKPCQIMGYKAQTQET